MRTIELNGNNIEIPDNFGELTLTQWVEINKIEDKKAKTVDLYKSYNAEKDPIKKSDIFNKIKKEGYIMDDYYVIDLLDAITGINSDDLTLEEFGNFGLVLQQIIKPIPIQSSPIVNIDGVDFEFIDFNKIKLGEYTSIKLYQQMNDNAFDAIVDILPVILRPIGEKYNVDVCEARKERFKKLKVDEFMSGLNFFLTGSIQSSNNMQGIFKIMDQTI